MISASVLKNDEMAIFRLRELYSGYGYSRYKVSKFEEYDLYAHNKSFLISENVLTFTDTDGRLMALKPDVTLSIVKNVSSEGNETQKLYYNENVYRTSPSADGFREIMQTGLECIGDIDALAMCEVLLLAAKSLDVISEDNILDISHMGFLLGMIENAGLSGLDADRIIGFVEHKNIPAIRALCAELSISEEDTEGLCSLTSLYAPMEEVLQKVGGMVKGERMCEAYRELDEICGMLKACGVGKKIYVDFSTVNDRTYYNGITFKGFVNGLPDSVLSGGRYDTLMRKMGKSAGAVGFAVYLDMLERMAVDEKAYDVDVLLCYSKDSDRLLVAKTAEEQRALGYSVLSVQGEKAKVRCKRKIKISGREVSTLEADD